MNVQDLINILMEVENKTLPVVLVADHGQTPMALQTFGEAYVENYDEHMMQEIDPDDLAEFDSYDEVFILEAM